jgi:hypothetical protein
MDSAKLRAWWWHRQGLDGSLRDRTPAEILERSGWARSVAGAGPYLTLFSRGGHSRAAVDGAVAALEIHELPAARGCTYVLPAADFALGLQLADGDDGDLRAARKLGVTDEEIEQLADAVCRALEDGPLDPEGIRQATGDAFRSLGEEGKKKGMTTTLPLALGRLQPAGRIRRIPVNGRLDQQRYRYALWRPGPRDGASLSREEAFAELARRYFRWAGPATLAEFQGFSGLGVRAAKAAVEPLGLEPMEPGGERLLAPEDREAFAAFTPPREPQFALVGSVDALFQLRRDPACLIEPADRERQVQGEKGAGALGGLLELPSHAILDRGRLVGLWEYDPETSAIAWNAWVRDPALDRAVAATEAYVRDQLGDARSFSLDSPKSRKPRIEALRQG